MYSHTQLVLDPEAGALITCPASCSEDMASLPKRTATLILLYSLYSGTQQKRQVQHAKKPSDNSVLQEGHVQPAEANRHAGPVPAVCEV